MPTLVQVAGMIGSASMLIYYWMRRRMWAVRKDEPHTTLAGVSAVYRQLSLSETEPAFAVFLVQDRRPNTIDGWNIQLSVEAGRIGFDWVLLAPPNIRDRKRFEQLAKDLGHTVRMVTANDVDYLRTEDGDLVELCSRVLSDLCRVGPDEEMPLIVEGFSWSPTVV